MVRRRVGSLAPGAAITGPLLSAVLIVGLPVFASRAIPSSSAGATPHLQGQRDVAQVDPVDSYVRSEMATRKIPGLSLAVVKDGTPIVLKGYGLANAELNVPVKPETIFQSGSMGKQFTAAAVMLLVEQGKIVLDEKISSYVGEVPDTWKGITVRQVLNHTSGMPNDYSGADYKQDWTEDQLLAKAKAMPLVFAPGEKWAYSNVGYKVLGIMVSKVSGQFYGDLLQERIFKPFGMTTTRIISEADIIANRADGYRLVNGELKNQEWVSPTMNTTADGSLYWSILDLVKWDEALSRGQVLKSSSWDAVYTPARLTSGSTYPYGFGWAFRSVNGRRVIEHNGSWQGFTTNISRYVDNRVTVIVLTNLSAGNPSAISQGIAEIVDPDLIERPITDADSTVTAAHRKLLESFASDTINRELFSEDVQEALIRQIVAARDRFSSNGPVQRFDVLQRTEEGDQMHHRYLVKFRDGAAVFHVLTNKDGKITAARPQFK